ncbi:Eaf5p NDAI_0D01330 [Naumovozyma dairenensis CBS 421]|uniref:Uncharacterized protein n=1 Tax=Naumovozyma dairenensis (strain ATCC 10597 / BCRC 20456 / CBS 421 / NBRC 0211 / NRRL Y-12639) TaxID=1071378 RepID=G0W9I6_NAUDC|nr:hypothetical protein NDAI_0D01330 [Naumovozyma dairenensis CBS 421]CCD24447.1 hypothetical protein NDAI_0D01330 [Naumovozyma dairenensis CBS 421]
MDPIINDLLVLQLIYSLLFNKYKDEILPHSNKQNRDKFDPDNDNFIISSIKLSLIKITDEFQNNLLINEMVQYHNTNNENDPKKTIKKLTINDILNIVENLFPINQFNITLMNGQLNFQNLKLNQLRSLIIEKYLLFRTNSIQHIKRLDDEISNRLGFAPSSAPSSVSKSPSPQPLTQKNIVSTSNNNISVLSTSTSPILTPAVPLSSSSLSSSTTTTHPTITTTTINNNNKKNVTNTISPAIDPKREKLLNLYRDTVLNRLQSKNKLLDELYINLMREKNYTKIINKIIEIEMIKNETPKSVHFLQLILQRSISDGIMSSSTGTKTWEIARQVQFDFDDTVQFMRRALE